MGCCFSAKIKSENPSLKTANLTHDSKQKDGLIGGSNKVSQLKIFTYNELKRATRNFRPHHLVGEGGFGGVFRGWLDEQTLAPATPGTGIIVAVKFNREGFEEHKEWLENINYLGQLHHPNIVKLIGYCLEDDHRVLVYEFLTKGSLEDHLFRRTSCGEPLSWSNRMKVALGAAKALAFLHSDEVNVIYPDLKASNILLDSNFNAKLSGFSLARGGPSGDESHVSTSVMGTFGSAAPEYTPSGDECHVSTSAMETFGYAAPEYGATGHLTKKCDVYTFGVVLLEILSGRRALDSNRPAREQNLVEWAKPYLSSKRWILQVMDARIKGQYLVREAMKVAKVAIQCLSVQPQFRPTVADVARALEQVQDSSDTGSSSRSNSGVPKQRERSTKESLNEAGTSEPRSSDSQF